MRALLVIFKVGTVDKSDQVFKVKGKTINNRSKIPLGEAEFPAGFI